LIPGIVVFSVKYSRKRGCHDQNRIESTESFAKVPVGATAHGTRAAVLPGYVKDQ
jgi:hypothetical protein